MTERDWHADYDIACARLKEAQAQYRLADNVLATARAKLTRAEREVGRLYAERMSQIDGEEHKR